MKRLLILFFTSLFVILSYSQTQIVDRADTALEKTDTVKFLQLETQPISLSPKYLNHSDASLGNKILRGFAYSKGFNLTMGAFLLIAPDELTMWGKADKFKVTSILSQFRSSYTKPPVWDKDHWYVNYIGHPYQGAFYYNSIRSQGATVLQSSLFCLGQSVLWEYVWEGGMEQPSIQDLIVTPVLGVLIGELSHVAAVKMSKNGYVWYEKVLVCIINPTYAINNGFKQKRKPAL